METNTAEWYEAQALALINRGRDGAARAQVYAALAAAAATQELHAYLATGDKYVIDPDTAERLLDPELVDSVQPEPTSGTPGFWSRLREG